MQESLRDLTRQPEQLTLRGGLRVRLLHLPHASQGAALVRVHAGAHDAPAAYPGLAHFLEHLLFLGSRRYPVDDSLMAYVQRSGGQLNASTRERHTDFFFQLPANLLEPGLQRLLDMLAAPLLDPAAQLREREVLQAEYLARAQDSETLCDAALGAALAGAHPFGGFHAGNRETLPVENAAFQQALLGYHRDFYQAGQMELLLAGPQPVEALHDLAMQADALLRSAPARQAVPPALPAATAGWLQLQLAHGEPRLNLAFLLDGAPPAAAAALDYLGCFLAAEAAHSLSARLREAGWCQALRLRTPYLYAGQGVVVVEAMLTEQGARQPEAVAGAIRSWLRFFAGQGCWQAAYPEYSRIRERSLLGLEPLARLRHWVEPDAWATGQDERRLQGTFDELMRRLLDTEPVLLLAGRQPCPDFPGTGFPLRMALEPRHQPQDPGWQWRLPAANPWLQPSSLAAVAEAAEPALRWLGPLDPGGQGVLHLRWRWPGERPPVALWHALADALQAQQWAARQAGVELRFEDLGSSWCLCLSGYAQALPAIGVDLCALLAAPPRVCFAEGVRLAEKQGQLAGDEMLIRQVIRQLPRLLDGSAAEQRTMPVDQRALAECWRQARWDALACGIADGCAGALAMALDALAAPSSAQSNLAHGASPGRCWIDAGLRGAETAVLLFCPLPATDAATEAAWRLLARLLEGDFFRRLRSELQLGYAVFSRFSQLGAQAGILFAVQSPNASAGEILRHIETFLDGFQARLEGIEPAQLQAEASALANLLESRNADPRGRAERAWQALLAGRSPGHPGEVVHALEQLDKTHLLRQMRALLQAEGGWRLVANAAAPSGQ